MISRLVRGTAFLAALLTLACGSDDLTGPMAGPLRVVLTSPNADDGAVMFQVIGVVDSVTAPAGITLYQSTPGPNVIRVIATGTNIVSGGNLLTLYVADASKTAHYTAQVLQVAAKVSYAQRAVGGYSLTVQK